MYNKSVNQCPQLTDDRWQKQKQQRQKKKKKKKKKRGTNAGRKMQADMSYNNRASTLSNVEQTARLTQSKGTESIRDRHLVNIFPTKLKHSDQIVHKHWSINFAMSPATSQTARQLHAIAGEKSGQPIAPTCPTSNAPQPTGLWDTIMLCTTATALSWKRILI
ncbi:hypothetical protein T4E_9548 [Trichinella pseudospiralis]|uniref:Uncharacterized protein n=1 Tax=Trichinella pseudospiralis TaxID=6337 RepID=A0A0V0XJA7_TRIPS|nr:hypothetical protein T4E_9548 [Trichinella pseudospiralis]